MYSSRVHKKKQILTAVVIIIILYCCLFLPYNVVKQEEVIKNVKPESVWEHVADFSKMKKLNPTIQGKFDANFSIRELNYKSFFYSRIQNYF